MKKKHKTDEVKDWTVKLADVFISILKLSVKYYPHYLGLPKVISLNDYKPVVLTYLPQSL